jgi:hypothetical protein
MDRRPISTTAEGSREGYHTKWTVPDEHRASPEYIEADARIAPGQAVYDRQIALGISQAEPRRSRRPGREG